MGYRQHNNKIYRYIPSLCVSDSQIPPDCNNLHAIINFFYVVKKGKLKFSIVVCLLLSFYSLINAQPTDSYPFQVKKRVVKRDFRFRKEVIGDYEMEDKVLAKESKRCIRNIKRHSFPNKKTTQKWLNEINRLENKSGFTVHLAGDYTSSHNYHLKLPDSTIAEISLYKVLFNQDCSNVAIAYYDYNKQKAFITANGKIYPFEYNTDKIAINKDDVYKLQINYGSIDSDTLRFPFQVTDSIRIYKLNPYYDYQNSLEYGKEVFCFLETRSVTLPQSSTRPPFARQVPFFVYNGNCIYQYNGRVFVNGELLNKKMNAESIIRYSIVKNKPSYLLYRNNEWCLSYDNKEYNKFGFDEILPLESMNYPCYPLADFRFYARKKRKYYSVWIR